MEQEPAVTPSPAPAAEFTELPPYEEEPEPPADDALPEDIDDQEAYKVQEDEDLTELEDEKKDENTDKKKESAKLAPISASKNDTMKVYMQDIGQIVGQHHVHMIQKGLPGEGNILLFDNGGQAGLGKPTPCAPTGYCNATRGYSRVLEINPVTMERVWSYNDPSEFEGNIEALSQMNQLFSHYCSSADRLPNGNTLITEMLHGRIIEVTPEREVVWEFINPGGKVFRAHRYPYAWCQQAEHHEEQTVLPVKNSRIRLNVHGEPVLIDENPFFG